MQAKMLTLAELTGAAISERATAAGEPAWLIERRAEAWDYFAQALPPEWRRTDLTRLAPETLAPPEGPQGTELIWDEALAMQGVVFMPLQDAVKQHEALIREKLGTAVLPTEHKFSAMRAALWQDGVFLYVPRNLEVEQPLRVRYTLAPGHQMALPRTLVVLENNARVKFVEEFTSGDFGEPVLVGPTTEIFAGPGSDVRFASVQHWGDGVFHIGGQKVVLERDANCDWVSVALGGDTQHIEAETRLHGDGSRVNWLGVTFANANQRLLTAPWLRHVGANCESFMEFKTVVNDHGYSIFDGMIKIEKGSQATSTRLEEHALHLSREARNDSIPGLKIDTNDVLRGGHASTSGEVDEEQLFYMQSRGIARDDARHLIVMSFFEPALKAIPVEELRERLSGTIEAKI
jgi:Fe-S cluster assembly protein SufD